MTTDRLIRESRKAAGLTQAALATRLGISQPALARLERPGTNISVATLARVLRAAGRRLELAAPPEAPSVDEAQIAANLRLTPAERLRAFERGYRAAGQLAASAERIPA